MQKYSKKSISRDLAFNNLQELIFVIQIYIQESWILLSNFFPLILKIDRRYFLYKISKKNFSKMAITIFKVSQIYFLKTIPDSYIWMIFFSLFCSIINHFWNYYSTEEAMKIEGIVVIHFLEWFIWK